MSDPQPILSSRRYSLKGKKFQDFPVVNDKMFVNMDPRLLLIQTENLREIRHASLTMGLSANLSFSLEVSLDFSQLFKVIITVGSKAEPPKKLSLHLIVLKVGFSEMSSQPICEFQNTPFEYKYDLQNQHCGICYFQVEAGFRIVGASRTFSIPHYFDTPTYLLPLPMREIGEREDKQEGQIKSSSENEDENQKQNGKQKEKEEKERTHETKKQKVRKWTIEECQLWLKEQQLAHDYSSLFHLLQISVILLFVLFRFVTRIYLNFSLN